MARAEPSSIEFYFMKLISNFLNTDHRLSNDSKQILLWRTPFLYYSTVNSNNNNSVMTISLSCARRTIISKNARWYHKQFNNTITYICKILPKPALWHEISPYITCIFKIVQIFELWIQNPTNFMQYLTLINKNIKIVMKLI